MRPKQPALGRRLIAEGIGSFFLFACVIGSGVMAANLSNGNDAVALLGNTIATGAILFVLITMLGPVSGAHMNPAVRDRKSTRLNSSHSQISYAVFCLK